MYIDYTTKTNIWAKYCMEWTCVYMYINCTTKTNIHLCTCKCTCMFMHRSMRFIRLRSSMVCSSWQRPSIFSMEMLGWCTVTWLPRPLLSQRKELGSWWDLTSVATLSTNLEHRYIVHAQCNYYCREKGESEQWRREKGDRYTERSGGSIQRKREGKQWRDR